jgi:MoaA/NifB/PqqE/SkfB family radical SAM enzyme
VSRSISLSWIERLRFLKSIVAGERAQAGPFTVLLDITRRCNLTCVGCRYHSSELAGPTLSDSSPEEMPVDLVERLCSEVRELGTRAIILISEGESLLHPRVFEIIRLGKSSGMRVSVLTNGTVLNGPKREQLIQSGLDLLKISHWGTGPDQWKINYPGTDPDVLRRVRGNIEELNRAKRFAGTTKPRTVIHYVINRHSLPFLRDAIEMASDTRCEEMFFSVFKTRRGSLERHALDPAQEHVVMGELRALEPELKKRCLAHNLDDVLLRYRIGQDCWQRLPCYVGWVDARVKMDGTVRPCGPCNLSMGNLNERSLKDIWNGAAYRDFRKATGSRKSLAELQPSCDCTYCCHVPTNHRIHRYAGTLSYLRPFLS